ncbi:MAG: hypothetical protein KatS3mg111_4054 [Pirellulaceae bacterium]|nr:MAG: hypothetical protein KatS3mg111_4054 [Pirellulaceae bacterium]
MEASLWQDGQWRHGGDTSVPLNHIAFKYGAIIADRLRTVHGKPADVQPHVERFAEGCRLVGIDVPPAIDEVIHQCAQRHRRHEPDRDFSIVLLGFPGLRETSSGHVLVHTDPIDHRRLARWYEEGHPLEVSTYVSVPAHCWPHALKHRSRLNYFLADRQAIARFGSAANAVLVDEQQRLTETSVANLLIIEHDRIVSPPSERILPGISLQRTYRLARSLGIAWQEEPIELARAQAADAILLCGSIGCLWHASRLGEQTYPAARGNDIYHALYRAWCRDLNLDYREHSLKIARRQSSA